MKSTCLDTGMPWLRMDGGRSGIRHRAVLTVATRPSLDRSSFFASRPLSSDMFALSPGQQRHQSAMTLTTATSSIGRGHACRSQFLEFDGQSSAQAAIANAELVSGRQGFLCGPQPQPVHVFSDGGSSPSSLPNFKRQAGATAFNCDPANLDDKLKITVNVHLPKWMRSKFPPNSHGIKTTEPVYEDCDRSAEMSPTDMDNANSIQGHSQDSSSVNGGQQLQESPGVNGGQPLQETSTVNEGQQLQDVKSLNNGSQDVTSLQEGNQAQLQENQHKS